MPIDAGDVVLTFLGDMTQLEQTFERVNTDAATKVAPAKAALDGLGVSLDATGDNAAYAGDEITSFSQKGAQAAAATLALKNAQDEFRAALAATREEGSASALSMARLSEAEERLTLATAAAKAEHAALKEQLLATSSASMIASEVTGALGGKLGEMFGIIAFAEGFKSLIEGAQHSVLQLELLSEKTGISISSLAGIQHVSEASGIAFEQVSTSLTRLARSQVLAIEGGKAQVTAFERIGVSTKELKDLNPEELFYRVADAMANAKSHGEAAASSIALLGKGGAALIPIFDQGSEKLRAMIDEAARASGVTKEAGLAARDWEAQIANMTEALRAGLIPAIQLGVPVIKSFETVGTSVAMIIRDIAAAIGGVFLVAIDGARGQATILNDILHGNLSKLASDSKVISEQVHHDFNGIGIQFQSEWQKSTEFIKSVWKDVDPLKQAKDDFSDLKTKAKKDTAEQVAAARVVLDQRLADIALEKDLSKLAFDQKKLDAASWARTESKAVMDTIAAHEQYGQKVVSIYSKAGEAHKADIELQKQKVEQTKEAAKVVKELDHNTLELDKTNKEFEKTSAKVWAEIHKDIAKSNTDVAAMVSKDPFLPWQKSLLQLNADLKAVGVQGLVTLQQNLLKAEFAEKRLNDAGIHEGKLWLQVQAAKLKAIIALEQAQGKATVAEVRDLQRIENELTKYDAKVKASYKSMQQMQQEMQKDVQNFTLAVGDAFGAMISGQESFGEAMKKATANIISQMAKQWAEYFAAKGIADIFWDPALGGAELAAAVALEAVASALGSVGSASSGGRGSSAGSGSSINAANTVNQTATNPPQTVNVAHLASGGLVTQQTLAIVGDGPSGLGNGREAVIPLDNSTAIRAIAEALGENGTGVTHNWYVTGGMVSPDNLGKMAKKLSRQVQTGRVRLLASNSSKLTRKA